MSRRPISEGRHSRDEDQAARPVREGGGTLETTFEFNIGYSKKKGFFVGGGMGLMEAVTVAEEVARDGGDPEVSWVGWFGYACRADLPARPAGGPVAVPDAVWMRLRNPLPLSRPLFGVEPPLVRGQTAPPAGVRPGRSGWAAPSSTWSRPTPGGRSVVRG